MGLWLWLLAAAAAGGLPQSLPLPFRGLFKNLTRAVYVLTAFRAKLIVVVIIIII